MPSAKPTRRRRAVLLALAATLGCLLAASALLLPRGADAGAPSNDRRAGAEALGPLPATASGTTADATVDEGDPSPSCAPVQNTLWYRLDLRRRGPVFVRLEAQDDLEAVVAVYRRERSVLSPILCRVTDDAGVAALAFRAARNASYLILVGKRMRAAEGPFRLVVLRPERPARPPGDLLPERGVESTVDALRDVDDAWSVELSRGVMYRFNVVTRGRRCLPFAIYRPPVRSFRADEPVRTQRCGSYLTFTPGPDGGGRYSLLVRAERRRRGEQKYRLAFAPAAADDTAPGILLRNGETRRASLNGRDIDVVDLYRFAVHRAGELTTIDLRARKDAGFDLLLLRLTGEQVLCECSTNGPRNVRRQLAPGHYYLAVRVRGRAQGAYALTVLVRSITTTDVSTSGAQFLEAAAGVPITITVRVTSPGPGGIVRLQFDRLDPLAGWQYAQRLPVPVGVSGIATTSWLPPSVGHWRLRARFLGTRFSNTSVSPTVRILVTEPLEPEAGG